MLITCEKCPTTYELDERLLPTSGAPVQCTNCRHVFIAKPPRHAPPPPAADPVPAPRPPTQVYGLPNAPPSAPQTAPKGTQMFAIPGAPQGPAPAEPPPRSTQMFAIPAAAPPAPPKAEPKGTQMFAIPAMPSPPAPPPEPATQPAAPEPRATQMFAIPAMPAASAAPAPKPAPPPASAPEPKSTQMFAIPPMPSASAAPIPTAAAPAPRPEPKQTQMFAMQSPPPAAKPEPKSTQMFALPPVPPPGGEKTEPMPVLRPPPEAPGRTPADRVRRPIAASEVKRPPILGPPPTTSGERRMGTSTSARVELPPEEARPGRSSREPLFVLEPNPQSRRTVILGALAIGLLLLVGYFAYQRFSSTPEATAADADVESARAGALSLLRKDDEKSREEAITRLKELSSAHPASIGTRADYMLALVLQLDDAQLTLRQTQETVHALTRKILGLQDRKSPADWQNRVNAMVDEQTQLKGQMEPLTQTISQLDGELTQTFREVKDLVATAKIAEPAVLRAQAVYFGVRGSDEGLPLAERYGQTEKDGWDDIAFAEYAANGRVPQQTLEEAQERMVELRERDATFLRASVLGARLLLPLQRHADAITLLEAVKALNPKHAIADRLLEWSRSRQENL